MRVCDIYYAILILTLLLPPFHGPQSVCRSSLETPLKCACVCLADRRRRLSSQPHLAPWLSSPFLMLFSVYVSFSLWQWFAAATAAIVAEFFLHFFALLLNLILLLLLFALFRSFRRESFTLLITWPFLCGRRN